ncbi:MAG: hypothetical protein ACI9VR_000483 [Cognaticolwellia sp.]|jgi:hypothetical protein
MLLLMSALASATPAVLTGPTAALPALQPVVLGAKKKGGKKKKKKKKPQWVNDWYVTPGGGGQVYSNGSTTTTTVTVGGEAGLSYEYINTPLPRWSGRSRVGVTTIASAANGASATGFDVRAGSFIGPAWKNVGIQGGPDFFYNQWTYRSVELDPTFGAELPVTVSAGIDQARVYVGVSPAWVDTASRRVDWATVDSQLPGFGHEFRYVGGINGVLAGVALNAQYEYRITAVGPVQSVMLSAQVDGATLWDIISQTQGGTQDTEDQGGGTMGGGTS